MSHFSLVLSGLVASCLVSSRVGVSFLVCSGLLRHRVRPKFDVKIAWSGQVWSGLVKVWSRPRPKRPPGREVGTWWRSPGGEGMTRHIRMGPPHRSGSVTCSHVGNPQGPFEGHLGAILGHLGAILNPSWVILGPTWPILGPSWLILGPSWQILGPTWPNFAFLRRLLTKF